MSTLGEVYLAARPDARGLGDLEARLEAACAAAAAALEGIEVDAAELAGALAGLPRSVDALDAQAIEELALALACARGDEAALRRFARDYEPTVYKALGAMKLADDLKEEVLQDVRTKLLVGDGGPARIVGYAGRGSLRGLLKVTATRTAISMLRKRGRELPGDEAILERVGERDPELAFLAERYRAAFREAFEEAVGTLAPRERNLLRLHFLRRVTLEALAQMYGVHRATIVRHLAKIRDQLDRATQAGLSARLGADRREVESIMDVIRSRFDASVERLLRTMEE